MDNEVTLDMSSAPFIINSINSNNNIINNNINNNIINNNFNSNFNNNIKIKSFKEEVSNAKIIDLREVINKINSIIKLLNFNYYIFYSV